MNKKIRSKCRVEITPVLHVKFFGVKDKKYPMMLPEDDGVVHEFLAHSLKEELFPLPGSGGTSGRGVYVYNHPLEQKNELKKFFKKAGIKVIEKE